MLLSLSACSTIRSAKGKVYERKAPELEDIGGVAGQKAAGF